MSLPRFTAEASLYQTNENYLLATTPSKLNSNLVQASQLNDKSLSPDLNCGPCQCETSQDPSDPSQIFFNCYKRCAIFLDSYPVAGGAVREIWYRYKRPCRL